MDERSNVDYLSLFPTSSSEEILYINTKYFLQDKFFIDFDSIIKDTHHSLSIEDKHLFDSLYKYLEQYAYGYSLDMFSDTTYSEYTHTYKTLFSNHSLLKNLNTQIKFFAIIMAYYTLSATTKLSCIPLLDCAIQYSQKNYVKLDNNFQATTFNFSDFCKADKETARKIRNSYNKLKKEVSQFSSSDTSLTPYITEYTDIEEAKEHVKQLLSHPTTISDPYLAGSINTCISAKHTNIGEFLSEFSFDLIVNRMQHGFNFTKQSKHLNDLLMDSSKSKAVFRREVRRFVDNMNIINYNFISSDTTPTKLLYNIKREVLFHRNMLGYLTSEDNSLRLLPYASDLLAFPSLPDLKPFITFLIEKIEASEPANNISYIISYLSTITIPVFTYSFYISLIEYMKRYNKAHNEMISLIADYLSDIQIDDPQLEYHSELITDAKADSLGSALASHTYPFVLQEYFDRSFNLNIDTNWSTIADLYHLQDSLASMYYRNIIQ